MTITGAAVYTKLLVAVALFVTGSSLLTSKSEITDVTIGGSIAEVTRTFTVKDALPGTQSVVIDHLPSTIDETSILVVGKGNAEIVSTVVQKQAVHRESDPSFQALTNQVTSVLRAIAQFSGAVVLQEEVLIARSVAVKQYVSDLVTRHPGQATSTTPIPLQQLTEALDYQEKEQLANNERLAALRSMGKAVTEWGQLASEMQNKLKAGSYKNLLSGAQMPQRGGHHPALAPLSAQLSDLFGLISALPNMEESWPVSQQVKELHINLHVPDNDNGGEGNKGRSLDFELSYMASPASWEAEYDLRVERVKASTGTGKGSEGAAEPEYAVRVGMYAVVAQATAEDWSDVRLHLSTTQAQQRIAPPSPPVRLALSFREPNQYMNYAEDAVGSAPHGHARMAKFASRGVDVGTILLTSGSPIVTATSASAEAPVMEMQADMSMGGVGMTGGAGQVGSPVVFHPQHRVNISSNTAPVSETFNHIRMPSPPSPASVLTRSTRIFIRDSVLHPAVFTYAVPTSGDKTAYLKAWTSGKKKGAQGQQAEGEVPLLESQRARVFIEDAFAGTTSVRETQPGSPVRLDLGQDKNIQLQSAAVLPRRGSQTEDKSTWFVTDKVKYLVESAEYAFSVRSSYEAPHLVVLSELLPHVGEEDIKLELLQPAAGAVQSLSPSPSLPGDVWSEEDFVAAVLAHPSLARPPVSAPASGPASEAEPVQMLAFTAKGSGNVVWAQWLQPGQTAKAGLHYRIIYPEGKMLVKQHHYGGVY